MVDEDNKKILIKLGSSYINGRIINDSEIYNRVGYKNYIMLYRKFPSFFKCFKECETLNDKIGIIPGDISLFITNDPFEVKSDIIKTIYYKKFISNNSYLIINNTNDNNFPTNLEEGNTIWILFSLIMVILIVFSICIFVNSKHTKSFFVNYDSKKLKIY